MAKYRDRRDAGRSKSVPFIPGESPMKRHARRKSVAEMQQEAFAQWCKDHRLFLEVKNEGHHWVIRGFRFFAEWWPSSAKLVFNHRYQHGVHCHDVQKLQHLLLEQEKKP